jgi:hypothetical protein
MSGRDRKLFHRAHYNIIAARINEQATDVIQRFNDKTWTVTQFDASMLTLENLALALAHSLAKDNLDFLPVLFLNKCSPNTDLYPWGELWNEEYDNTND